DVEPLLAAARQELGLSHIDPIQNYRDGGWAKKIASEREDDGINTLGG
ncbi:MAG: sugar isomerase, partial [Clostridia bacterium]|nr:sugar isomerase [Clostridia bacterium]